MVISCTPRRNILIVLKNDVPMQFLDIGGIKIFSIYRKVEKMLKHLKLVALEGNVGCYRAVCYSPLCGYYKEYTFMEYSKKDIFRILRHEYNVIVPRGAF